MLQAEGIEARAGGEAQGSFTGATPEVTVMVHARDADRARQLIPRPPEEGRPAPDAAE